MRDVAGTFVRQARVAENGVRESVCTFSISGGGPVGAVGVVVVVVVPLGESVGGANRSGGFAGVAGAAEAGTEVEADPGRASLKPIAEPATTASSSQRVARRGTR